MRKKVLNLPLLAVTHYGVEHQKKKAVEEMGELITALMREQDNRATPEEVITEIADVQIMMKQLEIIYGKELIEQERRYKQQRLLERMGKEMKGHESKD